MPGCSKASRGLSVLPRVLGIFTQTTISPGPSARQCGSRWTIHAGRNLPDKEFRYLRTVIVTAGVYPGLTPELITRGVHLRALARLHTPYVPLRVCGVLCFW